MDEKDERMRRISMPLPARYADDFEGIAINTEPIVMTSVGPRTSLAYRWKCKRCGKLIKQNTAAAQSHTTKHVREALAGR